MGRDSAGVPVSRMARLACFSSGTVSLQRSDCTHSAMVVNDHRRQRNPPQRCNMARGQLMRTEQLIPDQLADLLIFDLTHHFQHQHVRSPAALEGTHFLSCNGPKTSEIHNGHLHDTNTVRQHLRSTAALRHAPHGVRKRAPLPTALSPKQLTPHLTSNPKPNTDPRPPACP